MNEIIPMEKVLTWILKHLPMRFNICKGKCIVFKRSIFTNIFQSLQTPIFYIVFCVIYFVKEFFPSNLRHSSVVYAKKINYSHKFSQREISLMNIQRKVYLSRQVKHVQKYFKNKIESIPRPTLCDIASIFEIPQNRTNSKN